jgi:phage-related tail fiber protein
MPIFRGKEFVSSAADSKDSVRVATRSHVPLLGTLSVVDDVELAHRDRVLLAGQNNPTQNGIYAWNSITGRLIRSTDADSLNEVSGGLRVYVEEGTVNAQTHWTLTTPGIITLGVTELTFARENRVGNFDQSGTHGSSSTTNVVTLDESGQITSITPVDIDLDGGEF